MTIADINLRGIKQIAGRNSSTGDPELIESTAGAAHVTSAEGMSTPIAYEQETSLSSATALSGGSLPTGATMALIQAESQNVRWRDDGTNPTASVGQRLLAGESRWFGNLSALKFIEEAASAKLNVNYY